MCVCKTRENMCMLLYVFCLQLFVNHTFIVSHQRLQPTSKGSVTNVCDLLTTTYGRYTSGHMLKPTCVCGL